MLQTPDQVAEEPLGLVCVVLVPGLAFIFLRDSATKRRETAGFEVPSPRAFARSPSGRRTARWYLRVDTFSRGVETKMIIDSPDAGTCNVDPDLCRLIAQAHLWFDQLASGEAWLGHSFTTRVGI